MTKPAGGDGTSEHLEGTVCRVRPGRIAVRTGHGEVEAGLRGVLKGGPRVEANLAVVGDRVRLRVDRDRRGALLEAVLPRRNWVSRADPGDSRRERVLAANLDLLVVVVSMEEPAFNPRVLDRLLVLGEHAGVPSAVVLNKIDLVSPTDPRLDWAQELYRSLDYPVFAVCARSGAGCDPLRSLFAEGVSILMGPSGAGKTTLLNTLVPGLGLRTRPISSATSKGVHTTTGVDWIDLPLGGVLLDSPGLRSIQPFGLTPRDLAACFPEVRAEPGCRFGDCLHRGEPGCAVAAGIEGGRVDPSRHDSYLRILEGLKDG